MPLDSDMSDADSRLAVTFYVNDRTEDAQYKGKPFVRIMIPGDKTNIVEQPVREDHKQRFPRQWLHFQMQQGGGEGELPGTPLSVWNAEDPISFNENQMAEMQILKFQTVEQIALASDAQLQRVGMGAAGLQTRARAYLQSRNKSIASTEADELRQQVATMQAQMAALIAANNHPPLNTAKKKPGRPRKVNVEHNASIGDAGHE